MIKKSSLPNAKACKVFGVSRSALYKKCNLTQQKDDSKLLTVMQNICVEFSKYGYRRVTKELQRRSFVINHKKVRRLMKWHNLLVKRKRFNPKTTDSSHKLPRYPNLLPDLEITQTNQVWVTDITYVKVQDYFLYLALVMDLYSRKIVGWDLSRDVNTELTLTALKKAVQLRGIKNVKGCIHHSDHGVQYLAYVYTNQLKELGMLPSMGEVGNSYDNAFAESLNKTIKNEEVWINEYDGFDEAYENIARFIKKYNERRLHSSIGYMPPNEFEQETLNKAEVL
jgi:transposase InsO family protein